MWILECETDCLGGRRIWLKPGKQYLFGRTKGTGSRYRFVIDRPSISRQHITLLVKQTAKDDSANVAKKTKLVLKDEGSKFGTEVDGVRVAANSETTLSRDVHSIRLGKAPDIFRIRWVPVVLTFSLASKEYKSQDPLSSQRTRLENAGLDVKVSLQYLLEDTTHVVASKRNTAKGLSALVNGKYIVREQFVDAIIAAATPTDLDKEEEASHLEEDFEKYWPQAADFLPEKGKEPNESPAHDYLPVNERKSVFEGYTFIFCDQTQFDSLQIPISHGGGKAMFCATQPGSTTPEEVVRYVKTAAGEKGLGELEDGSEGKGVVVVRLTRKEKHANWATRIDMEVAQALDHRLIEQSEFLNAILANDASMLRKPLLPEDYDQLGKNGVRQRSSVDSRADTASSNTSFATSSLKKKREPVVSRFKGFDDDDEDDEDDEDSSNVKATPVLTQKSSIGRTPAASMRSQTAHRSSLLSDSENDDVVIQTPAVSQMTNGRKRPAPAAEEEEDFVDKMLPQHTARKRQKQANGEDDRLDISNPNSDAKPAKSKPKPKREPVNVKDAVRERREAQQEADDQDKKEDINAIIESMTVEEMQSLAVVEEVDIVAPRARNHGVTNGHGADWNDAWNDRKNFKNFRRKGTGETVSHRNTDRIIVPLEEAKKKDYGIGEEYWLERDDDGGSNDTNNRRRRKDGERRTQSSQSQSQSASNRTYHTASVPAELITQSGDTHVSETIDLDAPRTTRHQTYDTIDSTNRTSQSQALAEKLGARHQQVATVKLPGPRKRKKFAAADDSDESDHGGGEESVRFTKRVRGRNA